jgi:hypothetical protein
VLLAGACAPRAPESAPGTSAAAAETPDPAVVLARGVPRPWGLASDGAFAYWTVLATGEIVRAAADGTAPAPVAKDDMMATGCAVDADSVYWLSGTGVMKAPKAGGASRVLVPEPAMSAAKAPIALDATHVYWIDAHGWLRRAPKDGGPAQSLGHAGIAPSAMAVDATHAWWTDELGGVRRVRKEGGAPTEDFAAHEPGLDDLALDGAYVYWTNVDAVRRAPKSGGAALTVYRGDVVSGLAVDDQSVFTTTRPLSSAGEPGEARIVRIPKDGRAPPVEARAGVWGTSVDRVYLAIGAATLFVAVDAMGAGGGVLSVAGPGYTGPVPPPSGAPPKFEGAVFRMAKDFAARP